MERRNAFAFLLAILLDSVLSVVVLHAVGIEFINAQLASNVTVTGFGFGRIGRSAAQATADNDDFGGRVSGCVIHYTGRVAYRDGRASRIVDYLVCQLAD